MATRSDTTTELPKNKAYEASRHIDVREIPVVDMGPALGGDTAGLAEVATSVMQAARSVGFFYVKNHGVPWHLVEDARAAARQFFAQTAAQKATVKINANHRGFLGIGEAKMADYAQADQKESFVWGLEVAAEEIAAAKNPFIAANNWPDEMPELKAALYPYYEAVLQCGHRLLQIFALGMGLPQDSFVSQWQRPISRGSIVYYPPQTPDPERERYGVAPHTDYGCLTILCQDDVGGLEVQTRAGEWVTAHPIEGTFVVNVGDLLGRWTNDALPSTPHRVINASGRERYSLVVAVDPDYDTLIDPGAVLSEGKESRYPPIRCGDYILERFDKAFAYRKAGDD